MADRPLSTLLPGQKPTFDEMSEAVRYLLDNQGVTLADLPVQALKDDLEQNWNPSTNLLLGAASVTPDLLAPNVQKSQQSGAVSQSGPGAGVSWPYNVAGAPFVDLVQGGLYRIDASCSMYSTVAADYVIIGLWNETGGAGVSFSGGAATLVGLTVGVGDRTVTMTTFYTAPFNSRCRIWVVPNGGSIQTIRAGLAVPVAMMTAERIG